MRVVVWVWLCACVCVGVAAAAGGAGRNEVCVALDTWSDLQDDLSTSEAKVRELLTAQQLDVHVGASVVNVTSSTRFTTACLTGEFIAFREGVDDAVWHEHRLLVLPDGVELIEARVSADGVRDVPPRDAHVSLDARRRALVLRSRVETGRVLGVEVCVRQATRRWERAPPAVTQHAALLPLFEGSLVRRVAMRVEHDDVRAVLVSGEHGDSLVSVEVDKVLWAGDVRVDKAAGVTHVDGYAKAQWTSAVLVWERQFGAHGSGAEKDELEEMALVVHVDERTQYHVRNTLVRSTSTLTFSVAQGLLSVAELGLTGPMRVLSVDGAEWSMEDRAHESVLVLRLAQSVRGGMSTVVSVRGEFDTPTQVPGKPVGLTLPRFRALGGARHTGMLAISTADNLEVHERTVQGLMRRDPAEVHVPGEGAGPIVYAYQFFTGDHTIKVSCTVHADATVLVTSASAAHVDITMVEHRALIRMRALVRNTGSQFLRVHVPRPEDDVTELNVWSARIDGHVVKPAVEKTRRDNVTTILLPLSEEHSRNSKFAVEVVVLAHLNTTMHDAVWAGESGTLALPVPQLSAPINELSLTLHLPEKFSFEPSREWASGVDRHGTAYHRIHGAIRRHLDERAHAREESGTYYYTRNRRQEQHHHGVEEEVVLGGMPMHHTEAAAAHVDVAWAQNGNAQVQNAVPSRAQKRLFSQMNGTEFAGKLPVSVAELGSVGRTYHYVRYLVQHSSVIEHEWTLPYTDDALVTRVRYWGDVTVAHAHMFGTGVSVLLALCSAVYVIRRLIAALLTMDKENAAQASSNAQGGDGNGGGD